MGSTCYNFYLKYMIQRILLGVLDTTTPMTYIQFVPGMVVKVTNW